MTWSTFWPDVLAGFLGAAFGVGLALLVDRSLARSRAAKRDVRIVQNLINRLAAKRAFGHPANIGIRDDSADKERCRLSVSDARERIAATCEALEVVTQVVPILRGMEKACMDYLNFEEKDDLHYAMGLVALKRKLMTYENLLGMQLTDLAILPPGDFDSAAPGWLPAPKRRSS